MARLRPIIAIGGLFDHVPLVPQPLYEETKVSDLCLGFVGAGLDYGFGP